MDPVVKKIKNIKMGPSIKNIKMGPSIKTIKSGPSESTTKYDICANCGHYYFLHLSNFKDECDACDSPEIKMENKCLGFKFKI